MIGSRFGRLTIIANAGSKNGSLWLCRCDCGHEVIRRATDLRRKIKLRQIPQCGIDGAHIHDPRIHRAYWNMRNRCYCPSASRYENYGGRGIIVCQEWLDDYWSFERWALGNGYASHLTLERLDVNGNYEPLNCRWATTLEQVRNRRITRRLTWKGETMTPVEWAAKLGISAEAIQLRVSRGWSVDRIFTQPYR